MDFLSLRSVSRQAPASGLPPARYGGHRRPARSSGVRTNAQTRRSYRRFPNSWILLLKEQLPLSALLFLFFKSSGLKKPQLIEWAAFNPLVCLFYGLSRASWITRLYIKAMNRVLIMNELIFSTQKLISFALIAFFKGNSLVH